MIDCDAVRCDELFGKQRWSIVGILLTVQSYDLRASVRTVSTIGRFAAQAVYDARIAIPAISCHNPIHLALTDLQVFGSLSKGHLMLLHLGQYFQSIAFSLAHGQYSGHA
jgi:hypothetical protein